MKACGKFIYKSLEKRDGGEFVNSNGQTIKFDEKSATQALRQTIFFYFMRKTSKQIFL